MIFNMKRSAVVQYYALECCEVKFSKEKHPNKVQTLEEYF